MEIKTTEQLQLKEIYNLDKQFYSSLWLKRKWVAVDDILKELKHPEVNYIEATRRSI